jgi:hypothetical protein
VDESKNLDGVDSPENLAGIKVAGRARRRELFTVQLASRYSTPSLYASIVPSTWRIRRPVRLAGEGLGLI